MAELGELEKHSQEFASRNVRVFVISNDPPATAKETQADFPHLTVVSDEHQNLAKAIQVIHPGAGRTGDDTNAPTTFLVNGTGQVRWYYRPTRFLVRLPSQDLVAAIDQTK